MSPCELDPQLCYIDPRITDNIGVIPGCALGLTEMKAGKLLAKHKILRGEYIEVSRGLLLPTGVVLGSGDLEYFTLFGRKLEKVDESSSESYLRHTSLLLLGHGSLYGNNTVNPNVEYYWWNYEKFFEASFDVESRSIPDEYIQFAYTDTRPLNRKVFSPENCNTTNRVWVAFIANRDIEVTYILYQEIFSTVSACI